LPFTLKEIAINDGWQSGLSAIVDSDRLSPLIKAAFFALAGQASNMIID